MGATSLPTHLRPETIDGVLEGYLAQIEGIGSSIGTLRGLPLIAALKRDCIRVGPYPTVSLFEAANRVMTDLVLLYGIRWLLRERVFPFLEYQVEFGHGNRAPFDLMAEGNGQRLIGEAFNVAPSFFQGKKTAMLKKLRTKGVGATYTVILCNADAVEEDYAPIKDAREFHVFVNVGTGAARMVPAKVRDRYIPAADPVRS